MQPLRALIAILLLHITLTAANAANPPNVLLILVDDLRPELRCYGIEYIHSPNIDSLASKGRLFTRHYVQAPTCGASRFALLTGRYGPHSNDALFQRARDAQSGREVHLSMPEWFRQHGYQTVSIGKVSHHPGGRGGPDWDDASQPEMPDAWEQHLQPVGPWLHPRGVMHGLANGQIRVSPATMDVFQSYPGDDASYPDGLIVDETLRQIDQLSAQPTQPFFLAVGLVRPHLPFGAPAKYMEHYHNVTLPPIPHPKKPTGRTTWHRSSEFMSYNRWNRDPNLDSEFADEVRRHYAACVTYADAQVGRIMTKLQDDGMLENTIVVLWGDHGWHLGEHGIWGKHSLFEESLRAPLIIYYPGIPQPDASTDDIVETIDLFPTLCDLAKLPVPSSCTGTSLVPQLRQAPTLARAAVSYTQNARTIRNDQYRLILHRDGYCELYDHKSAKVETQNLAESHPQVVAQLREQLEQRWPN